MVSEVGLVFWVEVISAVLSSFSGSLVIRFLESFGFLMVFFLIFIGDLPFFVLACDLVERPEKWGGGGSSVPLPECFVDGLPCFSNGQCEISTFGVLGDEVLWRCPRLRKQCESEVLDRLERKHVKKKRG